LSAFQRTPSRNSGSASGVDPFVPIKPLPVGVTLAGSMASRTRPIRPVPDRYGVIRHAPPDAGPPAADPPAVHTPTASSC
jgi:hypothetical protein